MVTAYLELKKEILSLFLNSNKNKPKLTIKVMKGIIMIRVNDDYVIEVDAYNYTACKDRHRKDKNGEDIFTTVGHYSDVEGAIGGIIKDMKSNKLDNDTYSLEEAINVIRKINGQFKEMLERALNER